MQGVDKRVDKYQYNTAHILGTGSYGTVYKGVNYLTQEAVALKMMPRIKINEPEKLNQEIVIMQKLQGPNIVRLIETLQTANNYYQVLDLCETDLQAILKKEKFLTEAYAIKLMVDLLNGFLELIQHGVIHRDVKPANIMFGGGMFKLADFGFARMVDNYAGQKFVTILGTPLYMSPEILQDQPYTSKSDIWSLGFIFYEALFGITPWTANSVPQLIENIHTKPLMFPDGIKKISELTKDVIRKCLIVNENDRIGWYDLFRHPLFEPNFQNMKDLKQRCEEKAKYIVNRIRGVIFKMEISIEDLLIKMMIPQEIQIKDIENLFKKVDSSLTRIEAEHIFNDMTQGRTSISVEQFKQWLVNQEVIVSMIQIPFRSTRVQQQQSTGGIDCITKIKSAMNRFNQTSEQYFNRFNTEQDGKLKYSQYKLLVLRIDKGLPEKEIEDSYRLFDSQQKGYITKPEFDILMEKYEIPI